MDPASVAAVRGLRIDEDYLREVIGALTSMGSSDLGFRTTGTAEDAAVAAYVAAQMRAMGLTDVAVEDVEVDAWCFRSAGVTAADGAPLRAVGVSWGGVAPTGPGGITAALVDVGDARRRVLDRRDLRGALALVDWRHSDVHPSAVVLELARRGAVGLVVNCPPRGPWWQSEDALGAFDGHWPPGAPPMVLITKEDAAALRKRMASGPLRVTMHLDADLVPRATGHNVVGYLAGEQPGPIVVGAHHDAWFRGAFDNTSGVAAMLALARALLDAGHRPQHTIVFTSRTAEEYGIAGSAFDWCIGAWGQIHTTHPEWAAEAPFHLCLEASGHAGLRSVVEAPVELATWARRVCRTAAAEGWAPTGWRVAPPVSGTEQWPLLVSGVPGVAAYAWETSFARTDYHSQYDTEALLDYGCMAAQTRMYALLLLEADRAPGAILDHAARGRQLSAVAGTTGHEGLAAAARDHTGVVGRDAFTAIGRGLFALDAHGAFRYPHAQCVADAAALDAALAALDAGDRSTAARQAAKVGSHHLVAYLSEAAFVDHDRRFGPDALTRTWGSRCHLTASPHLWQEISTLRADPGARPDGPWVRAGLVTARTQVAGELTRRLDAMTASVTASNSDTRTP